MAQEDPLVVVERLRETARRKLAGYADLRTELAGLTATASAANGEVTVTVRAGGALERLDISDAARRHGPSVLARTVLSTIQAANARYAAELADRVALLPGAVLNVGELLPGRAATGPRHGSAGTGHG